MSPLELRRKTNPETEGIRDLFAFKYAASSIGCEAENIKIKNADLFNHMSNGDDFGITYKTFGIDEHGNHILGY